ncbi:MAG: ATP-binding protein [Bacillota bacterium]
MKLRNKLFFMCITVWLAATAVTAGVLFVRSAGLPDDAYEAAAGSLRIGALVGLPVVAAYAAVKSGRLASIVEGMLAMTGAMLSGRFRERFFPDTDTELDTLGSDLNRLAESLRARMQDLHDSNAKLEATLNASVSGIIIFDCEGRITAINLAAKEILGRTEESLHGLSFVETLSSSDLVSLVSGALYRQAAGRQEVKIGRRSPRVVDATAAPLQSREDPSHPVMIGVVLTLHDLTEIRRLERMRTDFVQNVSHELRTPVTVVKGFAETLRDTPPDDAESVREMASLIDAEASRLSTLVGSLLDLAKLESGSIVPAKVPLDPARILRDTVKRLESVSSRNRQTVSIVSSAASGGELIADPTLTDMVFTNLLENALKYGGEGGRIEMGVRPDDGGWLFWVVDDGPGIDEEDLPRVFERFYRGSKDRSRGTGGSGLGLAVVKHSVTLQGGRVWAESGPGRGAAFYVWLPGDGSKAP